MTIREIAIKSALLAGLVMTGVVESAAKDEPLQTEPSTGPASVELVIQTLDGTLYQNIYFASGSSTLSQPARLLLNEIAADLEGFELADIALYDGPETLDIARVRVVAEHLEKAGLPSEWVRLEGETSRLNLL
jgi:hypothetical protein